MRLPSHPRYSLFITNIPPDHPTAMKLLESGIYSIIADSDRIRPELKELAQNYIYGPCENITEVKKTISRVAGRISPKYLGAISAKEVTGLIATIIDQSATAARADNQTYIIDRGKLVNFKVKVEEYTSEAVARVKSIYPDLTRTAQVPVNWLQPIDEPEIPTFSIEDSMAEYKKFIILDGHNLVYRAYFWGNAERKHPITKKPIGGPQSMFYQLLKFRTIYPEYHQVVVFDPADSKGILKAQKYPFYKSGRAKKANRDDLQENLYLSYQLALYTGASIYTHPMYEADEIIAHLVNQPLGDHHIIVSEDADLLQLVSPKTALYRPKDHPSRAQKIITHDGFPHEVNDVVYNSAQEIVWVKTVLGDQSDSIPSINVDPKVRKGIITYTQVQEIIRGIPDLTLDSLREALRPLTNNTDFLDNQLAINYELVRLAERLPNAGTTLSPQVKQPFNGAELRKLLVQIALPDELTNFDTRVEVAFRQNT